MAMLDDKAKEVGITILGEMGLDPGIGKGYFDGISSQGLSSLN